MAKKNDYLTEYRQFFEEFAKTVEPNDQLPVKLGSYKFINSEVVGGIVDWCLQYLTRKSCPSTLIGPLIKITIEEIRICCKKHPIACGFNPSENVYEPLKLMQTVMSKMNEICLRFLDNSQLDTLPTPPLTTPPKISMCASRNTRRRMEDRHVVIHDINAMFNIQDSSPASYYAIFDGHAGSDAAAYSAAHLHQFLVESEFYPTDPEKSLKEAFLRTDEFFVQKSKIENFRSGTTAVCALYKPKEETLYVAWVGDSQALLVNRGKVLQIVKPHKPCREDEKDRIEANGGCVMFWGMWRVNGQLAVSRAIGDLNLKPYVTAEPDIVAVPLDGNEEFLIMACDGLWDFVSEDDAAIAVYKKIKENPENVDGIAESLSDLAKQEGSRDNISVVIIFLKDPLKISKKLNPDWSWVTNPSTNKMQDLTNASNAQFDMFGVGQKHGRNPSDDTEFKRIGTGHIPSDLFLFDRPANGKRHADHFDDEDDDFGPESNVDDDMNRKLGNINEERMETLDFEAREDIENIGGIAESLSDLAKQEGSRDNISVTGHALSTQEMMQNLLNDKDASEIEFHPQNFICDNENETETTKSTTPSEEIPTESSLSPTKDCSDFAAFVPKPEDPMTDSFYQDKEDSNPFDSNKVQVISEDIDDFIHPANQQEELISPVQSPLGIPLADTPVQTEEQVDLFNQFVDNIIFTPDVISPAPEIENKSLVELANSPIPSIPIAESSEIKTAGVCDVATSPEVCAKTSEVCNIARSPEVCPETPEVFDVTTSPEVCPKTPEVCNIARSPEVCPETPEVCDVTTSPEVCPETPEVCNITRSPEVCPETPEVCDVATSSEVCPETLEVCNIARSPEVCPKTPDVCDVAMSTEVCAKTPEVCDVATSSEVCNEVCDIIKSSEVCHIARSPEVCAKSPDVCEIAKSPEIKIHSPEPEMSSPVCEIAKAPLVELVCEVAKSPLIEPEVPPEPSLPLQEVLQIQIQSPIPELTGLVSPDLTASIKDDDLSEYSEPPVQELEEEVKVAQDVVKPLSELVEQTTDLINKVENDIQMKIESAVADNKVEDLIQDVVENSSISSEVPSINSFLERSTVPEVTSPLSPTEPPETWKQNIEIKCDVIKPEFAVHTIASPSEDTPSPAVNIEAEVKKETVEPEEAAKLTTAKPEVVPEVKAAKTTKSKPLSAKKPSPTRLSKPLPPKTTTTPSGVKRTSTNSLPAKPKPSTTPVASPRTATTRTTPKPLEKKPLSNGDVKPTVKTSLVKKTTTSSTASACPAKPPTTRVGSVGTAKPSTLRSNLTSSARPANAATATTTRRPATTSGATATKTAPSRPSTTSTLKSATATTAAKPRLPTASAAPKPRVPSALASKTTMRTPDSEKEKKETVNKQLSASRVASRTTTSKTTSLAAKKLDVKTSTTGRTTTRTTTTTTATKKPQVTKTTITRTTSSVPKAVPKQNGVVSVVREITTVVSEDAQLVKDNSPVEIDNSKLTEIIAD